MQQITSPSSFKDQLKVYCLRSRDSIKPDVLEKKLGQSITSSVETNSGFWKIGESLKDISRVSSMKCSIKAPALCNTCVYVLIEIYLKLSNCLCPKSSKF